MAGANASRTSHVSDEVPGNLQVEWSRIIDPYIPPHTQVVIGGNTLYVATAKGLYAFDPASGNQKWVFGTRPLGHAPTYDNGVLFVGSLDHRLYAITDNGTSASLKWSYQAGAGFETNPVVVNNRVYIGNRDGYFYCLDALTGTLIWRWQDTTDPQPDAPIRFSPAYKNGVLYFASDNSHAYALRDNGASAALVWKSAKLPGTGFTGYWPVIYTDTSVTPNRDYVLFSGSKKATRGWFELAAYNYETLTGRGAMFGGSGGCSNNGTATYLWAPGTVTYDCSVISNYFSGNPGMRHLFVFDAATGAERTSPYAPVNWAGVSHGGNKAPPVVGSDGVLYTYIGFNNAGSNSTTGTQGWIAGWQFGTSITSRIYNPASGAGDEPVAFTSGGRLIYWGEGVNADAYGSVDITRPVGSNSYRWDPRSVPGKYTSNDLGGRFGGSNGVYTYFDGVLSMSPIPYNGRLYLINGNSLIAMSVAGGNRNLGTSAAPGTISDPAIALTDIDLRARLESEILKFDTNNDGTLDHLRPGFHDVGILAQAMADGYGNQAVGNHLFQYFQNPGDTLATLAMALPYLSAPTQTKVRAFMQAEESAYPVESVVDIGWRNGAAREIFDDTSIMTQEIAANDPNFVVASGPRSYWRWYTGTRIVPGTLNPGANPGIVLPEAFYGAWKYATVFPADARRLFDAMRNKLPVAGTNNDMGYANTSDTQSTFAQHPHVLNEYIIGYRGYLELEKLAGYTTDISQSTRYAEYQRLISLRLNTYTNTVPWDGNLNYANGMNVSRNLMYMTPELAEILRTNKLPEIQAAVNTADLVEPYWFVSKFSRTYGEGIYHPLYDKWSIFQARAYVLRQPFNELVKFIDRPAFWRGDLYYIQNLIAALSVANTPPPPPNACDLDGNGVTVTDVQLCVNQVISIIPCTTGDINRDTECNVLDVQRIVNAILDGVCVAP